VPTGSGTVAAVAADGHGPGMWIVVVVLVGLAAVAGAFVLGEAVHRPAQVEIDIHSLSVHEAPTRILPGETIGAFGDYGTPSITATGDGDAKTQLFRLWVPGLPPGGRGLMGTYSTTGPATFFLVPAGTSLSLGRRTTPLLEIHAGATGGFSGYYRRDGVYYLVVQTRGRWSLEFSATG
jgi:hypothetical protein